jgi:hypothetical protein
MITVLVDQKRRRQTSTRRQLTAWVFNPLHIPKTCPAIQQMVQRAGWSRTRWPPSRSSSNATKSIDLHLSCIFDLKIRVLGFLLENTIFKHFIPQNQRFYFEVSDFSKLFFLNSVVFFLEISVFKLSFWIY